MLIGDMTRDCECYNRDVDYKRRETVIVHIQYSRTEAGIVDLHQDQDQLVFRRWFPAVRIFALQGPPDFVSTTYA